MIGFLPYGLLLQVLAIIHFIRRRPDTYWLWIILIIPGGLGALAYIFIEVLPDFGILRDSLQVFPRRKRIKQLEGMVVDNPSIGNYEELGDLYLDDGQFVKARQCFDKVLAREESIDPLYRRALSAIALNDLKAALPDLENVTARDPKYDYQRAAGLLAHVLGRLGERDRASTLFAEVTETSTLSETQYNYAAFLAETGRPAEAREWAERILRKKATMPDYIRRRERSWFQKAKSLVKSLPRA